MINRWILSVMIPWAASTSVAGLDECSQDYHCDDFNPCTRDVCQQLSDPRICVNNPLSGTACNDGNACTTNDTCADGVCRGTPRNCDDGNACTIDGCSNGECTQVTRTCNDFNLCTNDSCNPSSGCVFMPRSCGDGNVCTTDTCSPATGCTFSDNSEPCDDAIFCTVDDVCANGECGGNPRDCSEVVDQCRLGVCNEATNLCEPQPAADGSLCDDDDVCTFDDRCISGICRGEQAFGLEEWRQLAECYDGVGVGVEGGCGCFDPDDDGDVDLLDVAEFLVRFDGG